MITQGIYEHYKSTPENRKLYQVLMLSHNEETLEIMVHYIPLYTSEDGIELKDGIAAWTRRLNNFSEDVEYNGKQMPHFTRIDSIVQ